MASTRAGRRASRERPTRFPWFSDLSSGIAYFLPAGVEHDVFNGGYQELVFVEIEIIR